MSRYENEHNTESDFLSLEARADAGDSRRPDHRGFWRRDGGTRDADCEGGPPVLLSSLRPSGEYALRWMRFLRALMTCTTSPLVQ